MSRVRISGILIHVYMIVTVLALLTMIPDSEFSELLYTLGASSWWVALGLTSGGAVEQFAGVTLVLWYVFSPILWVVFYVLACKKKYIPFFVLVVLDSAVVLFWYFNCCTIGDVSLARAGLDAGVSILYTLLLGISMLVDRRHVASRVQGDGDVVPSKETQ